VTRPSPESTALDLLAGVPGYRDAGDWDAIAGLRDHMPNPLVEGWLDLADEVAFALGHLGRLDEAIRLYLAAYDIEPTRRRASSLAYLHYAALMEAKNRRQDVGRATRDRELDRKAFVRWMQVALGYDPGSIKDLYRLGIYEAQIESQRDVAALRAFEAAIRSFRDLDDATRDRRHDLVKPYHKSLYAGARSAFRLDRMMHARKLAFDCIREDRPCEHVEGLFKMFLAGKVCAAQGQPDHAERAFRLALDAKGPRDRDFVFAALASLARRTGRMDDAAGWIERNVSPHRRKSYIWRLLGDIRVDQGRDREALAAYENAQRKDRGGRHLTLVRLGRLHLAAGRLEKARNAFDRATDFRKSRYMAEDRDALMGLIEIAKREGQAEREKDLVRRLAELPVRRRDRDPDEDRVFDHAVGA